MKHKISNIILIILLVAVSGCAALWGILYYRGAQPADLTGIYVADVDFAGEAAEEILEWFGTVQGVEMHESQIREALGELSVRKCLVLTQTEKEQGDFSVSLSEEDFTACEEKAYAVLQELFLSLCEKRLYMAGYEQYDDSEAVRKLAEEALQMPVSEYLRLYGPEMLPSYEETEAQWAVAGVYSQSEGKLFFSPDSGSAYERDFSVNGVTFVLLDENRNIEVYTKKEGE